MNLQLKTKTQLYNTINPQLKTSIEKRHYGTIPGSALATQSALSHTCAMQTLLWSADPAIQKQLKSYQKNELLRSLHRLILERKKSKWFVMTLYNHI